MLSWGKACWTNKRTRHKNDSSYRCMASMWFVIIFYGTLAGNIHKLQCAQNSLSRVVLSHHHGSSSSRQSHLHWLPVHRRIQFKIALITYKTLSTDQPPYLRNLINPYRPSRSLAQQTVIFYLFLPTPQTLADVPSVSPHLQSGSWNKLPTGIRESNTLHTSKHPLKHFASLPS